MVWQGSAGDRRPYADLTRNTELTRPIRVNRIILVEHLGLQDRGVRMRLLKPQGPSLTPDVGTAIRPASTS